MGKPQLAIIVARAANGVIGRDNGLPWHLSEDLAHFRRTTMGCPIVMGRRTFESLGRPLPGRRNLVVTRSGGWSHAGVEIVPTLDEAIARCADADTVFVIGGAQLYAEAIPRADRLVITEIQRNFDGDVHFPAPDPAQWRETAREPQHGAHDPSLRFDFVTYERRRT